MAWLGLRNQPDSALSTWYRERVRDGRGRVKRIAVTALARKLLVALWRFVAHGLVPAGADEMRLGAPAEPNPRLGSVQIR